MARLYSRTKKRDDKVIEKQHIIESDRPYIQSVMGKYGRCYYFRRDEYVGKSIFQYGEFSPLETEFIVNTALANPGLVLDIGANIGCISQALVSAGVNVEAFEPQPAVYELLVKNCPTIRAHNVGLGSKAGVCYMPRVDYSKEGNFGGLGIDNRNGTLPIEVRTLDSYGYDNVSFIKIDVEGYEEEVLRGGVETIARCKPIIYLEADRKEKLASLAKFLESIGYSREEHNPPLFSEDNFFQNKKRIWSKNYISANWLCKPLC